MRACRLLLLPLLAGLAISLAGALTVSSSSYPHTAPPPALPLRPDSSAAHALAGALERLSADQTRWIKAQLWQKVDIPPLAFQAEGLYQGGPAHRLRLELRVRSAGTLSRLLMVSDGQTLWQVREVAGSPVSVSRMELPTVLEAVDRPEAAAVRADFYQNQFFAGLVPLLRSLQEQVTFTRLENSRWREHHVLVLTGARSGAADSAWPVHLPRQCRLFLDAQSLWPHRLEWWGPAPNSSGDMLLAQVEFRDPVLNQPASDDQFTFQPGQLPVDDVTARWTTPPALPE